MKLKKSEEYFYITTMNISRRSKSLLIILLILVADQILKIWVKTNFSLGDEIVIFKDWFILHFVENNGMAFGFEFAGEYGKMFLSIFRIVAVIAIGWYLLRLTKMKNLPFGFIVSISLILAGAIGNIIDSLFYGMIFDHSYGQVASLFPDGGGYAGFLHGKVVDMFYFRSSAAVTPTGSLLGRKRISIFQTGFQYCRLLHYHRNFFHPHFLPELFQQNG
jgi:signal peptidase II